jgi:hypothetical protein
LVSAEWLSKLTPSPVTNGDDQSIGLMIFTSAPPMNAYEPTE